MVTNATPFINIPNYPEVETLMATLKALPHQVIIDADSIAKEAAGNVRASNFVMMGAGSSFHRNSLRILRKRHHGYFRTQRCDVVEMNLKALRAGREFAQNYIK